MKTEFIKRNDGTTIEVESLVSGSNYLGVLFSGLHYNYKNPLLYYSRNILFELKIDYIAIDGLYYSNNIYMNLSDKEKAEYIESDKDLIAKYILDTSLEYKKCILIGKSLGTHFIRRCLKEKDIKGKAAIVLFTPGIEWNDMIPEIIEITNPCLIIGGTKDKLFNVTNLERLKEKKERNIVEIQNADHSLEVDNISADLDNLKTIMEKEKIFIETYIR